MMFEKHDSLFLRLLVAQLTLVGSALLIFGALLVIDRNELVAPQYADNWAPRILAMTQSTVDRMRHNDRDHTVIVRRSKKPEGLALQVKDFPAIVVFTGELARYGVNVKDAWLRYEDAGLAMWLLVDVPNAEPMWLSGIIPPSLLPVWKPRLTIGLVLLGAVIGLVSWGFARRVTNPLADLSARMHAHSNSGLQPSNSFQSMLNTNAPPELIEIDTAYRLLSERLQRNERERALLLAGVSHDLRSPLSRIRLAAEMLPEVSENAAGVASITRNVDEADRLTASFLEFIRASTVPLNETVDLALVARRALEGFEKPASELQVHLASSVMVHQAHSLLLERLIFNLVDNAFKHGRAPVEVHLRQEADLAKLVVYDAGPGLPKNGAGELLEAFARGDASRGLPGFGLGLAIAQQIVARMRGELLFGKSDEKHQVVVCLPVHAQIN